MFRLSLSHLQALKEQIQGNQFYSAFWDPKRLQ